MVIFDGLSQIINVLDRTILSNFIKYILISETMCDHLFSVFAIVEFIYYTLKVFTNNIIIKIYFDVTSYINIHVLTLSDRLRDLLVTRQILLCMTDIQTYIYTHTCVDTYISVCSFLYRLEVHFDR